MENNKEINEINLVREALLTELIKHDFTIEEELSIAIELYFIIAKRWLFLLDVNGAPDRILDAFPPKCKEIALAEYDKFLKKITDEEKLGDCPRIELFLLP